MTWQRRYLTRFQEKLEDACSSNNSRLCVGLDPDLSLISVDEVVEFNRVLIDATADMACAYKPNLGIYESLGRESFDVLEATLRLIRDRCPGIPDHCGREKGRHRTLWRSLREDNA